MPSPTNPGPFDHLSHLLQPGYKMLGLDDVLKSGDMRLLVMGSGKEQWMPTILVGYSVAVALTKGNNHAYARPLSPEEALYTEVWLDEWTDAEIPQDNRSGS